MMSRTNESDGCGPVVAGTRVVADPSTTAVLCVECQNGMLGPDAVLPALAAEARGIVGNIERLVAAARSVGVPVVHATFEGFVVGGEPGPERLWRASKASRQWHPGHPATQVIAELLDPGDLVLPRHHGLSPTGGTELLAVLRSMGIRTVILAGVSVNVAILLTAADASQDGFRVLVARDAVAGVPAAYTEEVLRNTVAMFADLTTVDAVTAAWTESVVQA